MKLSELFEASGVLPEALFGDPDATDMVADSRQVTPGALFVCMPSANTDSHRFIKGAVEAGAVAILTHSQEGFELAKQSAQGAFLISSGDAFRNALWKLSKAFFGNPTHDMQVVGVTGTNGKTTTAWILRDMLQSVGINSAYLGTLGFAMKGLYHSIENTTPFSVELNRMIKEARDKGVWSLAMEVSSHALKERRADGIEFDAAIFTNLTQDHLDYHGGMADYENSKLRLFTHLPKTTKKRFCAAINVDDPTGARWAKDLTCEKITYGLEAGDLIATPSVVALDHIQLELKYGTKKLIASAQLGGLFNVQNCLSAVAGFLALGNDLEVAALALEQAHAVPGRFEPVKNDKGIGIIVDYAHTPDALAKLLESVRALARNKRIITVFGCGGDRDKTKRPKMAGVVSELSDVTVVTSDNPRTEDPEQILKDVVAGVHAGVESVAIIDRREAVAHAISIAKPGDVVVIAGKGHEDYQIIGRTKHHMDDRELAREALGVLA